MSEPAGQALDALAEAERPLRAAVVAAAAAGGAAGCAGEGVGVGEEEEARCAAGGGADGECSDAVHARLGGVGACGVVLCAHELQLDGRYGERRSLGGWVDSGRVLQDDGL